jgi:putative peptidoglycan lipid II flippase
VAPPTDATPPTDPVSPPGEDAPGPPPPGPRGARSAAFVSAGILLSRIAGLLRERAIGHFFGASLYADAWRAALRLPNVLQNLLGEGTLSASFIPVYARLEEEGRREVARSFAGAVFGLLFMAAGALVLLGMALAPLLVALFFAGFDAEQQARTTALVRILFPMTGILVLSAWSLGILNTHRRFFLPYVAPVAWNGAILAALVAGGWFLGFDADALLRLTAFGALAGGVLQFGLQLPAALRAAGGIRPTFRLAVLRQVEGVREAVRTFVPVLLGRGVVNLSGLLDFTLAALLATGALAVMGYAQTLYMLPISLFGMAVAASELPELARRRAGSGGERPEPPGPEAAAALRAVVRQGMARVAWFLVPSVAAYLVLGNVVVAALYQTGAFGAAEVRLTWAVLAAYALGMGASATSRLLSSAFYALGNTKTPAWVAALRVGVALALGAALMFPLDRIEAGAGLRYGAVGLALGSAAAAWLELGLLRRKLGTVIGPHGSGAGGLLRLVGAATLAVAVGAGVRWGLDGWIPALHPIPAAVLILGATGGVYLGATRLLGVPNPLAEALGRRIPTR